MFNYQPVGFYGQVPSPQVDDSTAEATAAAAPVVDESSPAQSDTYEYMESLEAKNSDAS